MSKLVKVPTASVVALADLLHGYYHFVTIAPFVCERVVTDAQKADWAINSARVASSENREETWLYSDIADSLYCHVRQAMLAAYPRKEDLPPAYLEPLISLGKALLAGIHESRVDALSAEAKARIVSALHRAAIDLADIPLDQADRENILKELRQMGESMELEGNEVTSFAIISPDDVEGFGGIEEPAPTIN